MELLYGRNVPYMTLRTVCVYFSDKKSTAGQNFNIRPFGKLKRYFILRH